MSEAYHPTAERLEALVEGSLPAGERVVLESHLLGCPACQAAADEWRALFAALASLPQFEPTVGFADRVMARVRVAPRSAWQDAVAGARALAGRAGAAAARVAPKTNFGWTVATVLMALPLLIGGGLVVWLSSRTSTAPTALYVWLRDTALEGLQGVGATAISALMTTDVAAWIVANASSFVANAGVAGVGALAIATGVSTVLSIWVLYRNLFRNARRESRYALRSI